MPGFSHAAISLAPDLPTLRHILVRDSIQENLAGMSLGRAIIVMNADGSGVVQITNDPNVDASLGLDWR